MIYLYFVCILIYYITILMTNHQVGQSDLEPCSLNSWPCLSFFCSWDHKPAWVILIFSLQNSKPYKAMVTITLRELTKCVPDDNICFCTFRTLPVFVGLLWKGFLLCVVGGLAFTWKNVPLYSPSLQRHLLSVHWAHISPLSPQSSAEQGVLPRLCQAQ